MALTIILVAQQFGYAVLAGAPRVLSRAGVALVTVGTIVMTPDVRRERFLHLGAALLATLWLGSIRAMRLAEPSTPSAEPAPGLSALPRTALVWHVLARPTPEVTALPEREKAPAGEER